MSKSRNNEDAVAGRSRAADLFSPQPYRGKQNVMFQRLKSQRLQNYVLPKVAPSDDAEDSFDPIIGATGANGFPQTFPAEAAGSESSGPSIYPGAALPSSDHGAWPAPVPDQAAFGGVNSREIDEPTNWEVVPDAGGPAGGDPSGAKKPIGSERNLKIATIAGVALLLLALVSVYYSPLVFGVLLYAFCVAAVIEWKSALQLKGRHIPLTPIILATVGMGVATWFAKPEGLIVALLVGCAGVVAWRVVDERITNTLADAMAGLLTLMWVPFLASFLLLLAMADEGWQRVFVVVLAVVGNDTGALFVGKTWGKHKLLERVSPAKTWEGAIGGVIVGVTVATVAAVILFPGQWYIGLLVGLACCGAAIVGDLAESAIKRDLRIKDLGDTIPGHGGVLDRLDSLIFASPVAYVVFAVLIGTL